MENKNKKPLWKKIVIIVSMISVLFITLVVPCFATSNNVGGNPDSYFGIPFTATFNLANIDGVTSSISTDYFGCMPLDYTKPSYPSDVVSSSSGFTKYIDEYKFYTGLTDSRFNPYSETTVFDSIYCSDNTYDSTAGVNDVARILSGSPDGYMFYNVASSFELSYSNIFSISEFFRYVNRPLSMQLVSYVDSSITNFNAQIPLRYDVSFAYYDLTEPDSLGTPIELKKHFFSKQINTFVSEKSAILSTDYLEPYETAILDIDSTRLAYFDIDITNAMASAVEELLNVSTEIDGVYYSDLVIRVSIPVNDSIPSALNNPWIIDCSNVLDTGSYPIVACVSRTRGNDALLCTSDSLKGTFEDSLVSSNYSRGINPVYIDSNITRWLGDSLGGVLDIEVFGGVSIAITKPAPQTV